MLDSREEVIMTPEILRMQLAYKQWQTQRLLDGVRALPADVYELPRGSSHGGIKGTLEHIYGSDLVWMRRIRGIPTTRADIVFPEALPALETSWLQLLADWRQWAVAMPDAKWDDKLHYYLFNGSEWSTPLWQIVLHVVNHGTLHGGQVVAMLRQAGLTPPQTDLIFFYREFEQSKS